MHQLENGLLLPPADPKPARRRWRPEPIQWDWTWYAEDLVKLAVFGTALLFFAMEALT